MGELSEYHKSLAEDKNNMSYWLPKINKEKSFDTFVVPDTAIVQVPERIMEMFFMEKKGMTQHEMMIEVMKWTKEVFVPQAEKEIGGGKWFIKNGAFSNKFDFSSCMNISSNYLLLTSNIIDINYQSLCFDTGGNTELVARRFIDYNEAKIPCIYNGMPLRTEVRVFYDFDIKKVLYAVNYWDWNYCYSSICRNATDKIVYENYYDTIKKNYEEVVDDVIKCAELGLMDVDELSGVWSIDFMIAEDRNGVKTTYLIDIAEGPRSAYWNEEKVKAAYKEELSLI